MKEISWRTVVIAIVFLLAIVFILPQFVPGWLPKKKINLGLDLQGGMHLVLEVQTEKAVESAMERYRQELRAKMKENKIRQRGLRLESYQSINVKLKDKTFFEDFQKLMKDEFQDLKIATSSNQEDHFFVKVSITDGAEKAIKELAIKQAEETIRNRVDEFGVAEPDIRIQGEKRIIVQLPSEKKNMQHAKDLLGKTALLEFKLVDDKNDLQSAIAGNLPPGTEILYQENVNKETGETSRMPVLVQKNASLTGASLTDARLSFGNQYNEPYVSISFDKKGARDFARITGDHVGERLAIVLDRKVYSAPVIQEKISGGNAQITGRFTTDEAQILAIALRAGALPAPVKILFERTVGPSLGADSIRLGINSMIIGGILVILFMVVYYKISGFIADVALLINIVLIAAGLAAFGATLTLPGIAGIILTIGMAVDANVLIFERIREELHLGKTPRAAIVAGYEKATLTILDANVTTLIAALVIIQFGTGPVKGFAITLSLGVLSSLFTALILTRNIFDLWMGKRNVRQLSI